MQFSIKKLIFFRNDLVLEILFISLLLTPFQNIVDIFWMFGPSEDYWLASSTPASIKVFKDFLLISIFFIFLKNFKLFSKANKLVLAGLSTILIIGIIKALYDDAHLLVILSGVRWFLPIMLFPLFDEYQIKHQDFLSLISRYRIILYSALVMQIAQALFSARWVYCSTQYPPICARSSGFFAMPQPMSIFALFFIVLVYELPIDIKKKRDAAISVISIFLTKSAAGFLGVGALLFWKIKRKYKFIALIFSLAIIFSFPIITGRADYWQSPLIRFEILNKINYSKVVLGSYTNTCINFQKINNFLNICVIPDSFLVGLLGNLGILFSFIIVSIISYYIYKSKRFYHFAIFFILLIAGNYTEYYPIYLFFPFMVSLKILTSEKSSINL